MSKYGHVVTVFPKRKKVLSTCRELSRPIHSLWGCISQTHMLHVDIDCPQSCSCTCSQFHWHGTSSPRGSTLGGGNRVLRPQWSLCVLLGRSVLVHESFESSTMLIGSFCVAHRALFNVEFVRNCKLAARIDLRGLRCNSYLMRLIFSSEVHVFTGDFTSNVLPVVFSLLFQNWMLFRVGGWHPY
jgi:hypothetical protein